MGVEDYITVTRASKEYGVSRNKLHRLIRDGKLHTRADPRDARVSLLARVDLQRLFGRRHYAMGGEAGTERIMEAAVAERYAAAAGPAPDEAGRLTPDLVARMDALRERLGRGGRVFSDSAELIREGRRKRTDQLLGKADEA